MELGYEKDRDDKSESESQSIKGNLIGNQEDQCADEPEEVKTFMQERGTAENQEPDDSILSQSASS